MRTRTTTHSLRPGFTLIEILIVITIVAILAAMGFRMGMVVLMKAKNLADKNAATALARAIEGYYDEYGHLPQVGSGGGGGDTTTQSDSGLMNILQAVGPDGKAGNPKAIRFFKGKRARGSSRANAYDGLLYVGRSSVELFDVWKKKDSLKRYQVVMDSNLDGEITDPISGETYYDHLVLVWSTGRDGEQTLGNAKDPKNRDNVHLW